MIRSRTQIEKQRQSHLRFWAQFSATERSRMVKARLKNRQWRKGRLKRISVQQRFWIKIERRSITECWPWTAAKDIDGYGRFRWWYGDHWGNMVAHRAVWIFTHGPIPKGMVCCHHCDNPSCCNPAHLFIGSQQENDRDRVSKNRQAAGENHGCSKLTNDQVIAIRQLYQTGHLQRELAARFHVSDVMISNIVRHKAWRHIE